MDTRACLLTALQALTAGERHTFKVLLKSTTYRSYGSVCQSKLEEAPLPCDVVELLVAHYTAQYAPFVVLRLLSGMRLKQQEKELRQALVEVKEEKLKKEQMLSRRTRQTRSMSKKKANAQDSQTQLATPESVESSRGGCSASKGKSTKAPAKTPSVTKKMPTSNKKSAPKDNQDLKVPERKSTTAEKNAKSVRGSIPAQKAGRAPQVAVRKK